MFTYKQSVTNSTGGATTLVLTPTNPLTVGSLVILHLKFLGTGTSPTATDNASTPNTYANAVGPITNATSGYVCYQLFGVQVYGGATTITLNWTNSDAERTTMDEFGGALGTNAVSLDKGSSGTGTSTSGSVTAFAPNLRSELISAAINATGMSAQAAGAGYTLASVQTNQTSYYRLASTLSETAPITWTTSDSWVDIAVAYNTFFRPINILPGMRPHPFKPGTGR